MPSNNTLPTRSNKRRPLRIGLVLDSSLDLEDGVQQYVMTLGEWLRRQGHEVHYLVGQTVARALPNIHSLSRNVVIRFNGNRINLPLWARRADIKKLFRSHSFDVLYVQMPYHPLMAQRVIQSAPRSTVIVGSFNILPLSRPVALLNKALRLALLPSLRRVDRMFAVSPAAADYEQWAFGLPAEVSPNVFDYQRFHAAAPFARYQDARLTILFVGRLVERKGCLTLLRAITALSHNRQLPPFRVIICGKGPLEGKLKQYCVKHGLTDVVEFTGFIRDADKPGYYASADVAVFPSYAGESFGIVLLEAMASGRAAVLAGDNPGYRSVMEPRPELLFAAKNPTALAAKLQLLLTDDQQRRQLADWGGSYARRFDIEVVGTELVSCFESLCASKNMR